MPSAGARGLGARLVSWILALGAAYLLIVLAYWFWQERLIYFPGPPAGSPPPTPGLAIEETWIETDDGERLHAWLARPSDAGEAGDAGDASETASGSPTDPARAGRGAVIVCHGNGGNLSGWLPTAQTFGAMGYVVLLFDYRGYGGSSGRSTEEGTYRDAVAAYDRLTTEAGIDADRIVAYGQSLGGAVAIELAGRRRISAVVVESTFTSMADIGAQVYPWLPVRLLVRARYDSLAKIGSLDVPVMVIHSPEDDLIPFGHGERLFEAAREPKRFLPTSGGHNDWGFARSKAWCGLVREFLSHGG
jgi:fermentation-respiration switch protein FrsA (DUF1100 family)